MKTKQQRNKEYYLKNRKRILKNQKAYAELHKRKRYQYVLKYRGERDTILHGLKINGCAICGYNKCDRALDFHHVNPQDKKFRLNRCEMSAKDSKILDEINKCILLCANCHREIHFKERMKE